MGVSQKLPCSSASAAAPASAPCASTTAARACGYGKSGLSSISLGGRGASFNIPVARAGGPRTTVGLPGTGLSWSMEHGPGVPSAAAGLPNSRRFRPGQLEAFRQGCLGVLQEQLFAPGSAGQRLWEDNLITRLLADPTIGGRTQGLLAVIETPEAMQAYLLRAVARTT